MNVSSILQSGLEDKQCYKRVKNIQGIRRRNLANAVVSIKVFVYLKLVAPAVKLCFSFDVSDLKGLS